MKTKYLLPSSWRPFGLALFLISTPLILWWLIAGEKFPLVQIPTPWKYRYLDWNMFQTVFVQDSDGTMSLQIVDELLGLLLIAGLFILGFSRLKIEDERIAQIRLESLQWGIYTNYLILFLCICLVYDMSFFYVMIYNMFTPLVIFVVRFYWLLLIKPAIEARKERSLSL